MTKLKTAVIGVGALGRHHARILNGLPNIDLVAVVDSSQQQGESVAVACETQWLPDCDSLPKLDAVSIVVPTVVHHTVASKFLETGVGVFLEKPITPTAAEGRDLVKLAETNNCVLQIGHVERFNPAMLAAREVVGDPRYIRAERVSPYTFRSTDIGVTLDLMIHDIDLVLSMVRSEVANIEAFGTTVFGPHEDIAQARIRFANGCIADITANRVNPAPARTMQVWSATGCTNIDFGKRTVNCLSPDPMLISGQRQVPRPTSIEERNELMQSVFGDFIGTHEVAVADSDALTAELTEFAGCVATNSQPTVSGRDGLAAVELAEQIASAIKAHSWDGDETGSQALALRKAA